MSVSIIVGCQYGDEGKGRASHMVSGKQEGCIMIRSTGGNNAGHTVVAQGEKYKLHLLPSGIIREDVECIISPCVVVDLEVLSDEIRQIEERGISLEGRLFISDRAHVIMRHHLEQDVLEEGVKAKKVGTTKKGMGPVAQSKMQRTGIRLGDLFLDEDKLRGKIRENLATYNVLAEKFGYKVFSEEEEFEYCMKYKKILEKYIFNVQLIINEALYEGKDIVIEGAQSSYLDIDLGDYPNVTSSNSSASGAALGAGIGPTYINEVIGVIKAYMSRVGNGPFITEEEGKVEDLIREKGHEYGTTTGRPRRCGWLDLVMIKSAVVLNGLTSLCLNHLDTLGEIGEELGYIKVCIGYKNKITGEIITHDIIHKEDGNWKPIYHEVKGGWSTKGIKTFEELPLEAKQFISLIENFTGVEVKYIGIGPDEKDTIIHRCKRKKHLH